jgi:omega-hydroxy-beta-dihydromenaquinone-9 sulfotransferase
MHPDLAWLSQYVNRAPHLPALAWFSRVASLGPAFRRLPPGTERRRSLLERLRLRPVEGYRPWRQYCGGRFPYESLIGVRASSEERARTRTFVAKLARYQGKSRMLVKLTGPARIEYLTSIFPDAVFIHLVRDGRAVVESLLRTPFWRDTERARNPAWGDLLSGHDVELWTAFERSPLALAAIEWRAIVLGARREAERHAPDRYIEARYEDFIHDPHAAIDRVIDACDLRLSPEIHEFLDRINLHADSNRRWREAFSHRELEVLNRVMRDALATFGYQA